MKRSVPLVLAFSAFLAQAAMPGEPGSGLNRVGSEYWLSFWTHGSAAAQTDTTSAYPPGWKSPKKALLLSAIVPGAGELYAGSKLKAIAFFGIEVAAWAMYASYHKHGKDKEAEFQAFADEHWSEQEYWEAVAREAGLDPNDIEALREYEEAHFSHQLHEQKDQQYYEMIGKYDQFNAGWDDTDTHRARDSKHRLQYEDMRDESNRLLKKATTGATIAMLNHVLSAIDAAWTTVRHNNRLVTASLRASGLVYDRELVPAIGVQLTW